MLLLKFLLFLLLTSSVYASVSPLRPDPLKTPGAIMTTDTSVICVEGYSKKVRNVSEKTKRLVYKNYEITDRAPHEYEIDHLISLELGGANDIENLWPQSYITTPLNARRKDVLENKLHVLVCSGELPIQVAQQEIATDWISAYYKYIPGPDKL